MSRLRELFQPTNADETEHSESIYQRTLAALDELKKSLLNRAFNGELTRDNG